MLQKTTEYATDRHLKVNHKYGDKDYPYHLNMVYNVAEQFIYLVEEEQRENVYCGCWVHDIIEDARETYNDVLQSTNLTIAELAYALTNEKGKNRNERANDKYYKDMHDVPNAVFIKFCDRIANIVYSKTQGSKMFEVYKKENKNFIKKLYRPELVDMIEYIDKLFNTVINKNFIKKFYRPELVDMVKYIDKLFNTVITDTIFKEENEIDRIRFIKHQLEQYLVEFIIDIDSDNLKDKFLEYQIQKNKCNEELNEILKILTNKKDEKKNTKNSR
jgi:hypothetical protein